MNYLDILFKINKIARPDPIVHSFFGNDVQFSNGEQRRRIFGDVVEDKIKGLWFGQAVKNRGLERL